MESHFRPTGLISALAVCATLQAGAVYAVPVVYVGADEGANNFGEMVNSQAAAASFDAATGPLSLIDFESPLPAGVTISGPGSITNTTSGFGLFGGNTTAGGEFYYSFPGQPDNLIFNFDATIDAFGAYLTGLQGDIVGQQFITYTDGSIETVDIPLLTGGGAFVGFTDIGASIASIELELFNDIVGIDDIRYGRVNAVPMPEAPTFALLAVGFAGLVLSRRKRLA